MIKLIYGVSLSTLVGAIVLIGVLPAQAEEIESQARVESLNTELEQASGQPEAILLSEFEPVATTIHDWLRPIAQAELIEITNVQIEETVDGVLLRLETNGELSVPETSITGNAAIADFSNVVLALPETEDVFVVEPAVGIALVTIAPLTDNRVRIAITGTDCPWVVAESLLFWQIIGINALRSQIGF